MTMVCIQQVCKSLFKIKQNKILFVTLILFLFQIVLINISCALGNRLVRDKEGKQYMTGQLKLEIELDKTIYKPEEPIRIKGKIENLIKETIYLKPVLFMDLLVNLKYEDGREIAPFGPIVLISELIKKKYNQLAARRVLLL